MSRIASGTAGQRRSGARLRGSWPKGCNWPAHSAGDHTGRTPRYQRAALTPPQPDWVANPARQHIGAYFATTGNRRISRGDIRRFMFALVDGSSKGGEFPAGGSLLQGAATTLARSTGAPPTVRLALDLPAAGLGEQLRSDPTKENESAPGTLHQGPITPAMMRATTYVGMILPETGTGTPKIAAPSFKVAPMCGFLPLRRRWERAAQLSRPGSIPRGLARARGLPPLLSPRSAGSRPVLGSWGSGGRVPPPYSVGNGEIFATGFPLLAVMGCEYETADMQAVRPAVPGREGAGPVPVPTVYLAPA